MSVTNDGATRKEGISHRLRELLRMEAEDSIDLNPGEQILHEIGRHWILLVVREIPPVAGALFFGGLASYRAIGGSFLVADTGIPTGLDLVNLFLLGVAGLLLLFLAATWVRRSKDTRPRTVLLIALATVLGLVYFRANGGRIFYVDPSLFIDQGGDLFNLLLMLLAATCVLFTLFTFYDWLNDELILTNQRVIYDNDQVYIPRLLEQSVQEQIYIPDIQNVVVSTKTYPQHWLKYGTIIIKSARIGGELKFDQAGNPGLMQKRIMDQVNAVRKQRSEQALERLVETQVYNAPAAKPVYRRDIRTTGGMRAVRWLIPENPEINEDNGSITWRAHWLFLVRSLVGPLLLLFLGLLLIAIGNQFVLLEPSWVAIATFVVILAFVAWAAWEIEDYRNDMYIVNPKVVIDIDQKPFGPGSRREAKISQINNITSKTTFVSNLLGYGDVFLETAGGGGKFTFVRVPHPRDVVAKINDYYVNARGQEKEETMNDMLALLRHYHEAQRRHDELKSS